MSFREKLNATAAEPAVRAENAATSDAYKALKGTGVHGAQVDWPPTIVATVLAFGVGLSVIAWLLRYLNRGSFVPFVIYRVVLGLLVLGLVGAGVLAPT